MDIKTVKLATKKIKEGSVVGDDLIVILDSQDTREVIINDVPQQLPKIKLKKIKDVGMGGDSIFQALTVPMGEGEEDLDLITPREEYKQHVFILGEVGDVDATGFAFDPVSGRQLSGVGGRPAGPVSQANGIQSRTRNPGAQALSSGLPFPGDGLRDCQNETVVARAYFNRHVVWDTTDYIYVPYKINLPEELAVEGFSEENDIRVSDSCIITVKVEAVSIIYFKDNLVAVNNTVFSYGAIRLGNEQVRLINMENPLPGAPFPDIDSSTFVHRKTSAMAPLSQFPGTVPFPEHIIAEGWPDDPMIETGVNYLPLGIYVGAGRTFTTQEGILEVYGTAKVSMTMIALDRIEPLPDPPDPE